jgi:putative nucleotidyltransferase with HDIG domain
MPRAIQWQVPIICLPIVYIAHRSYTKHLRQIEQEKAHVAEVTNLQLRTIETLATAIEVRDHGTHLHLQRVQVYAVEIGRELGLNDLELSALRAASLLHDIGKLAVPEQIISKPGKLTRAEFEKMKIHPVVGAEILERVAFPYPVVPIVRAHHEKWNGSGYPDGLKGEEIPIGARILAAVDCLDALASDRPYRRALPLDEAMAMVASESGTSFDPRVIEVLERRHWELEALARKGSQANQPTLSTDVQVLRGAAPAAGLATNSAATADLARLAQGVQNTAFTRKLPVFTDLALDEAAAVIAIRLENPVPYDAVVLFVSDGNTLHPQYVGGAHGAVFRNLVVPRREGLVGWVLENRTAIVNGNPAVEPGYPRFATHLLRSALAVPFTANDGTQGVLALYRCEMEAFGDHDFSLVHSVCRRVGLSLEQPGTAIDGPLFGPHLSSAITGVA